MNLLLLFAAVAAVLPSVFCESKIIVCLQTDNQLRVDCIPDNEAIATVPIRGYEFTSSAKGKEIILASNLTNKESDAFRNRISVSDLRPGFRMTMKDYKLEEQNTAFICKGIGQKQLSAIIESKLPTCSAVSLLLHSSPWLLVLLIAVQLMPAGGPISL